MAAAAAAADLAEVPVEAAVSMEAVPALAAALAEDGPAEWEVIPAVASMAAPDPRIIMAAGILDPIAVAAVDAWSICLRRFSC